MPLEVLRKPVASAIGRRLRCGAAMASAIDPEVLLHLSHNLRIREFVSGCDIDNAL